MRERYPYGKTGRATEVARSTATIIRYADHRWPFKNSHLEKRWPPSAVYQSSFFEVLPEGVYSLRKDIETTLADKNGEAVGLELGGPGTNLFGGFSDNFFHQTAGVTLSDVRKPRHKVQDQERNHTVIIGDMLQDTVKDRVRRWQPQDGIDLIMERMIGGQGMLPNEPFFMSGQADYWYQQLAEGGLLFAEVPWAFTPFVYHWGAMVEKKHSDTLDLRLSDTPFGSVIRLQKLPDAPRELPLLSPKAVIKMQQRILSESPKRKLSFLSKL